MGRISTIMCVLGALLTVACGASNSVVSPRETTTAAVVVEDSVQARYADALDAVLDDYERDLLEAASHWYPTYTDAYAASQRFIAPEFEERLSVALAERGLSHEELSGVAEEHPDFVREQNARHAERMAELRPTAFAIMGRISPDLAAPEQAGEPSEAVATVGY